jgi:hypothetical protein
MPPLTLLRLTPLTTSSPNPPPRPPSTSILTPPASYRGGDPTNVAAKPSDDDI